jgi:hypothetical protein
MIFWWCLVIILLARFFVSVLPQQKRGVGT